ncbi:phosphatidylinositol 5 phosphate 4 kinase type 2 [Echinococcus multilocularis]|uniref:1-phosphatidylinositol-5-phosphate 4-kinase n=1 Tax=Echinococcus multilocularis TaxID=6211 RepID=A0A068Y116_ECHMU|nr:phosphatidylinositol 5 phosphate 4 kinase type 2 [Echinococcus multilocularis]
MATQSKQKKLKGGRQKLKLFRANEPLKSVLMWGINHSLTTLQHMKPRAVLMKDDFKAYLKIKVKGHLFNKENMPSRFKFKEYCPLAFQNLRERFNVDTNDYWESFTRYQPLWDSVSSKSGSKLLVTYNRHYVLKMISSEEVEQMHHFIENYHEYIVNVHGQTLLPQYLGMYRITVNDQDTYLLAMRNVFSPRVTVHRKYDLKPPVPSYTMPVALTTMTTPLPLCGVTGRLVPSKAYSISPTPVHHKGEWYHCTAQSMTIPSPILSLLSTFQRSACILTCIKRSGSVVDREANEKEKSKPLPTLKDNDFMNDICELHLEESAKQRLLEHLERDIAFLQDNNLMDYSALIGIHDVELAIDNDMEEASGTGLCCPSSASPVNVEVSSGTTAGGVGIGGMGGHRGSGAEMLASAGDGLGEIFEERLFGPTHSNTASFIPSSLPVGSFPHAGVGVGLSNEPFSDFSPPNSENFDTLVALGSAEEGAYTPPESPSDDISHRFQPFTGDLNPISEFYAFRGSPSLGRPVIYFIALIDILTRYGMRKRTAQTYKTVKHGGANADQITTVRPEVYGRPDSSSPKLLFILSYFLSSATLILVSLVLPSLLLCLFVFFVHAFLPTTSRNFAAFIRTKSSEGDPLLYLPLCDVVPPLPLPHTLIYLSQSAYLFAYMNVYACAHMSVHFLYTYI